MRGLVHQAELLFGVAVLGVCLGGCATQSDALRLSEELGRAREDAAWQKARAAEFEARLSRLEQRTAVTQSMQQTDDLELSKRLERLIAVNEKLLAERAAAQPPITSSSATPRDANALQPAAGDASSKDEDELRALVERLRGRPGTPHGGLSREQENALRVLTRPERKLDTENPWQAAFY